MSGDEVLELQPSETHNTVHVGESAGGWHATPILLRWRVPIFATIPLAITSCQTFLLLHIFMRYWSQGDSDSFSSCKMLKSLDLVNFECFEVILRRHSRVSSNLPIGTENEMVTLCSPRIGTEPLLISLGTSLRLENPLIPLIAMRPWGVLKRLAQNQSPIIVYCRNVCVLKPAQQCRNNSPSIGCTDATHRRANEVNGTFKTRFRARAGYRSLRNSSGLAGLYF